MTSVETWIIRALEASSSPQTLRQIQRFIDETVGEELAVDTLKTALNTLELQNKINQDSEARYQVVKSTSKEDAMKRLFKD
ncbi:MAG: hypothetical protein AAF708_12260 [Deinococcota bacterium]